MKYHFVNPFIPLSDIPVVTYGPEHSYFDVDGMLINVTTNLSTDIEAYTAEANIILPLDTTSIVEEKISSGNLPSSKIRHIQLNNGEEVGLLITDKIELKKLVNLLPDDVLKKIDGEGLIRETLEVGSNNSYWSDYTRVGGMSSVQLKQSALEIRAECELVGAEATPPMFVHERTHYLRAINDETYKKFLPKLKKFFRKREEIGYLNDDSEESKLTWDVINNYYMRIVFSEMESIFAELTGGYIENPQYDFSLIPFRVAEVLPLYRKFESNALSDIETIVKETSDWSFLRNQISTHRLATLLLFGGEDTLSKGSGINLVAYAVKKDTGVVELASTILNTLIEITKNPDKVLPYILTPEFWSKINSRLIDADTRIAASLDKLESVSENYIFDE